MPSEPLHAHPISSHPRLAALLALLALALGASGATAQAPVPPRPQGPVYDGAGVVTPPDKAAIERISQVLWANARVAVVVATLPDLAGEPVEDVSIRIAKAWGVGGSGEDRGVLILMALREREIRLETGYGVEGYLPDGLIGEILDRDVIPRFRRGEYSGGLRAAVERIALLTAREYGFELTGVQAPGHPGRASRPSLLSSILGALFLLILLVAVIRNPSLLLLLLAARGGGRYRGGGFGGGGFGGGGFGGFGGGGFGGGGASRGW